MSLGELVAYLRGKGVSLWMEGDRIRYGGASGVMTPELLAEMRQHRDGLKALLKQASGTKEPENRSIKPRNPAGLAPATAAQSRLWFLARLEPDSFAYTIPQIFDLRGPLDRLALESAMHTILERHESLRTTLVFEGDQLRQKVAPAGGFRLAVETFVSPGMPDAESAARQRIIEWGREPFDLERGPLFRARLLELEVRRHFLFLAFHHAIADGWSLAIFNRELAVHYKAKLGHVPSPLPPLPIQYGDFAAAQESASRSPESEAKVGYWKRVLEGAPGRLELPSDVTKPSLTAEMGSVEIIILPAPLWKSLGLLAQESGATSFMALLAVFQIWLGRLAGVEDLVVGTPIAGRQLPEVQDLIGLFLNNLPLRADLSGNPTFRECLRRARVVTLDAFAHQDVPFDRIVAEVNPERNLTVAPVFQVMLNQVESGADRLPLDGLDARPVSVFSPSSKYDFTVYATPSERGTSLEMVYNETVFARSRASVMLHQLAGLIEQAVHRPDRLIRDYSLVPQGRPPWYPETSVPMERPSFPTAIECFESWVDRHPDGPALTQGGRTWTYAELDGAVGHTCSLLASPDGRPVGTVAVCGKPSPGLVAACLAVWRSGGVLTLVDPSLPDARKRLMAEQARVAVWLQVGVAGGSFVADGASPAGRRLDLDPDINSATARGPRSRSTNPEAYIFFTSGTTGVPKAVLGTHQGLAHFLDWQRSSFAIGPGDRVAQLTGLSFDVILRDLFLPLTSGATLCLPAPDHDYATDRVLPWLRSEGITLLHTVPSLAASWIGGDSPGALPALRHVFFAGEPLTESLVRRWRKTFPGPARIVNLYGPTETTLAKCHYVVPDPPLPGIQPVGRPLPQTQAWVLNAAGRLCGVGEPGEIVIRTPFRSRGYLNAQGEAAKKFLPNPFRDDPSDEVYFTGDRGRYAPDGCLEILGRNDRQVKIRGVRVELDEVNAAIAAAPGISSSTVVALRDETGPDRLVAYIVPLVQNGVDSRSLRAYLAQSLPSALVPSEIVSLERMPLTANGKIHFAALPSPSPSKVEEYIRPRVDSGNPMEQAIAALWQDLLPRATVSLTANFFDLGGHSLMAVQMLGRLRQVFGRDLSLRHLFLNPTISGLAKVVSETAAREFPLPEWCKSVVALQPGGNRTPLFIFPGGNGGDYELYTHAHMATEHLGLDQPTFGFRARGQDGVLAPHTTMKAMVRDYLAELRAVQPSGPYHFLGDCLGGNIAFMLACAIQEEGGEVGFLALADCLRPRWGEFQRYWVRSRAKRLRISMPGRILFNSPKLVSVVTPRGRQWLSEKLRAKRARESAAESRPLGPSDGNPPAGYWTAQGEAYRRALNNYRPGLFRGRLHLILSAENVGNPLLRAWGENASEGAEIHALPGDHLNYLAQGGAEVSQLCRAAIDRSARLG
jgi:amino acid adenylation domain-containing protein